MKVIAPPEIKYRYNKALVLKSSSLALLTVVLFFLNVPMEIVSMLLSNIVSNVPAVLIFKPLIGNLFNNENTWLYLAMSSTFTRNLTILGSIAILLS